MASDGDDEPADVSDRPGCLTRYLWALLVGTAVGMLGLAAVVGTELAFFTSGSEAPDDAVESESASTGPLSGTWAMYWTNSLGSENQAFTITFTGGTTGTLEILNDETEVDTAFQVQDDQVTFEFTRMFDVEVENRPWPEGATFEGRLTGPDDIEGVWARQDWECSPDTGCRHTGEWSPYDARLVRTSE